MIGKGFFLPIILKSGLSTLLRSKFGLRIFSDQISVARSSSDLSPVLDRIWVLALRLAGRLAELDLAHCHCKDLPFYVIVIVTSNVSIM